MKKFLACSTLFLVAIVTLGQTTEEKKYDKTFEAAKIDVKDFTKLKVDVGGDFVLQFQSLSHHADSALIPIGSNFNLPSANLNLNAFLAPGIKLNLEVYLSSRHHNETWVKGGYLLIDGLPFLKSGTADKIMKNLTVKIGDMEINYGDNHFYRSDNGHVINNPFVGNFILDGFAVMPAAEFYYRNKGILVLAGITSGAMDPALGAYNSTSKSLTAYNLNQQLQYYFKAGYDKSINEKIRVRPSVSVYVCPKTYGGSLYSADRAGSRYFLVMNKVSLGTANDYDITKNVTNGYFGPGSFTKNTSVMGNLYAWVYGFELFGGIEVAKGTNGLDIYARDYRFTSMNIQGIYYFGKKKQYDLGVRYNVVTKDAQPEQGNPITGNVLYNAAERMSTDRIQVAAGWKMISNILTKFEYVKQNFSNFSTYGTGPAGFEGFMVEATVSF